MLLDCLLQAVPTVYVYTVLLTYSQGPHQCRHGNVKHKDHHSFSQSVGHSIIHPSIQCSVWLQTSGTAQGTRYGREVSGYRVGTGTITKGDKPPKTNTITTKA